MLFTKEQKDYLRSRYMHRKTLRLCKSFTKTHTDNSNSIQTYQLHKIPAHVKHSITTARIMHRFRKLSPSKKRRFLLYLDYICALDHIN